MGKRVAEIGTAFGDGTAAMATTANHVWTAELDVDRVAVAKRRLSNFPNVTLLIGDWRMVLPEHGPFDLVFADCGEPYAWGEILELTAPGGMIVKDDLTPGLPIDGDPVREFLLRDQRVSGVEVLTTPSTAAIIATRCG